MDVGEAIEDLHRSSFVDILQGPENQLFLSVPLAASEFGRRKLAVFGARVQVEEDIAFLQLFGAIQPSDVKHGVSPRVRRLIRRLAEKISRSQTTMEEHIPILEFVCRRYPPAWLPFSELYEEVNGSSGLESAKAAVERFLEATPRDQQLGGWNRLGTLCRRSGNLRCLTSCLLQICELPGIALDAISNSANTLNSIFSNPDLDLDGHDKTAIVNRVIAAMNLHIPESDATDCSRLAWLYIRIGDFDCARKLTQQGLSLDPSNEYCIRLMQRLF